MAKAKKVTKPAPAENPSKRSLAANRRRRRARKNPSGGGFAANPPIVADLTHVLLPGFAAYAGTRVLARIVYSIVQKRWPSLGKHAHALASAAAFGGAWFFAHRVKKIAPYHDGIVMGSGVAALHCIAQTYLPEKYSWLLADCKPDDVASVAPPGAMPTEPATPTLAGDEYSYLEAQLGEVESGGSKRTRIARPPKATRHPVASAMNMAARPEAGFQLDPDLTDALDPGEDVDDLYSGSFSTNN